MADSHVKIPPKPQPQQKKKKKNAPDKPQPAWLFPPDEENPVLNPPPKTDDMLVKETQEREKALEYMKRRVHAAPDRPAPPSQLLTLVGIFLTEYGFNSTSRLYTNERKARQALNGWEDAVGKKIEKGTPTLEDIYRDWYREFKIKQKDETSSSESDSDNEASSDSESGVELPAKPTGNSSSDEDSEASSDGLGGSDVEMAEAPKAKKGKVGKKIPVSSSASTSSDSDADDEGETKSKPATTKNAVSAAKQLASKPTVGAMINKLKRKAASSSSDSSASSSSSEGEMLPPSKKAKTNSKAIKAPTAIPAVPKSSKASKPVLSDSSSDSSSAASSSSESEILAPTKKSNEVLPQNIKLPSSSGSEVSTSSSESEAPAAKTQMKSKTKTSTKFTTQPPKVVTVASSDSSATINGDSKKPSASVSPTSDTSSVTSSDSSGSEAETKPKVQLPKQKKKHEGARPTPLAALSQDGPNDAHIDNKYQSYEYADRAYKDLSVTRGKGFTKEKNKKKRGSYRGGAIDTAGGKGFKFED